MITRDFYYTALGKHVVHFRVECASYKLSDGGKSSGTYHGTNKPKSKTLCDHCQAIEKRLKRIAKAEARKVVHRG